MFRATSVMRLFMVMMLAFGLTAGAVSVASAQNISTGVVDVGGNTNNNGTNQGNTQSQDQNLEQGQDVVQDNTNNLEQDNTGSANAGSDVSNDCDASLVEDTDGDDVAECASGDASAGDSSVGDSDQTNAGSQSGHNSNSQDQEQNGGNQASAPSNSNEQNGVIDVTDIGGDITTDDDFVDNDGELDNSNNSQNNDGIQGNDNQVGGAEAISALIIRLAEIIAAIIGNDDGGGMTPEPDPVTVPNFFRCNPLDTTTTPPSTICDVTSDAQFNPAVAATCTVPVSGVTTCTVAGGDVSGTCRTAIIPAPSLACFANR